MKKESHLLPFFQRPDLSPFLVHLTKSTRQNGETRSAYDNVVKILKDGIVNGSNSSKGFIKGPNKAACFMDLPLNSLKYVLNASNTQAETPRYEPYGVIVSKPFAYKRGCRPVLYLSDSELKDLVIPVDQQWRVVRFEGVSSESIVWVHEREWRAKHHFVLPTDPHAVLVKSVADAKKLRNHLQRYGDKFKSMPSSIIPLTILCQGLPYLQH